ncbi:pentatricopeptide repeat domain-containing protein 3, mitochondrial [Megalops cyprinoides]|uniref:pentatricopeptide repeat domain-containing protein 3, mitochondrial n=1 Tax=Megalops cyprinoides TaxID=118141 RepID=UPI001863E623|nr:pentatricopeptide repeat domain-containing protein 3, mitochondrial [Megalops cyprinoides]
MAAPCAVAGLFSHRCRRIILSKLEKLWLQRNFGVNSSVGQHTETGKPASVDEIVVPKKKTWDKVAVLQALASTVKRDATAAQYMFQDDPYLTPKMSAEFKLYSLSLESGRSAAKYIVNSYPKFFQKDYAAPHIPCLMPETLEPQIEEVSEAALVERIQLRKVGAAVDLYDQLLQGGTVVSTDVTNDLLDLICFYGDRDPAQDGPRKEEVEVEDLEEVQDDVQKQKKGRPRTASELIGVVWRKNNNAERIFNLMPELNQRAYCALIRGMVKHGGYEKAFSTYTDMLNDRLTADVHTFNALINAAPEVREKYSDKWDLIVGILKQMEEQKVQPNLLTFNAVLKSLRRCGTHGRAQALHTLSEMKALGIEPSLASYAHVLGIFYKGASSTRNPTRILHEVLDEVLGKSFVARDPDDVMFFPDAMRICLDLKDVELAYRLHRFLEEGDNWQLLGDSYQRSIYYGRFFNLLCMMEHIDVVLKWYRDLIPSLYYPNHQGMTDLLQALDTDNRLDLIPEIWKDIKQLGHANRPDLVEEMLALMARDEQSPEIQESFADCALAVKAVYEQGIQGRVSLEWTASSLGNITTILLRARRTEEAWAMLQLFKANNRVPPARLLEEFLTCAQCSGSSQLAVELVLLANSFSLPATAHIAYRVAKEFNLSDKQKKALAGLEGSSDSSGSDSDSDHE